LRRRDNGSTNLYKESKKKATPPKTPKKTKNKKKKKNKKPGVETLIFN